MALNILSILVINCDYKYIFNKSRNNMFYYQAHYTTKYITLKNIKKLNFNLKYLNYYLIIFSKNLDLDFYIYFIVFIKVAL